MGIKVKRFWVVYDSTSMQAIDPEYLSISEEEIKKYMKENPMPEDSHYSSEELIDDLTKSSGFYCLPDDSKEETKEYTRKLIEDLRWC